MRAHETRSDGPPTSSTCSSTCCAGLNFGYFYDASPIIAYDEGTPPPYSMAAFTPSTVPGCRTPHVWLRDGRSLYDVLGSWFSLLRFDPALDVAPLAGAAADRNVPLQVLDVQSDESSSVYDRRSCSRDPIGTWPGGAMACLPIPWRSSIAFAAQDAATA